MIFQIMPKYKLRQLGEPIQYNDQIYIENLKLNCFINASTDIIEIDKKFKNSQKFNNPYKRVDLREINPETPRVLAYLSNYQSLN